jgi:hypothetical protein
VTPWTVVYVPAAVYRRVLSEARARFGPSLAKVRHDGEGSGDVVVDLPVRSDLSGFFGVVADIVIADLKRFPPSR